MPIAQWIRRLERWASCSHGWPGSTAREPRSVGQLLTDDIVAGADTLPYHDETLTVPHAPGIGVQLDRDRLAKYAELYEKEAANFTFHDSHAIEGAYLPKR